MTVDIDELAGDELSDKDLERQITRAHATRSWVFLHGSALEYRRHTERMLALEQEFLGRHPQRTWQASGREDKPSASLGDRIHQIREVVRTFQSEMDWLIAELDEVMIETRRTTGEELLAVEVQLLSEFSARPDGRMNKLEAHQTARRLGISSAQLAQLYRRNPPVLTVSGADRMLTEAGLAALSALA